MTEPVLTISHLTKQYDGQTVLDGINLEVHEGEVIVIVGPSGSGKAPCCAASTPWRISREARSAGMGG